MYHLTGVTEKYFTIVIINYDMEIGKSFAQGGISWNIRYKADEPTGDGSFDGEIEIGLLQPDEVEFPVKAGVRRTDDYISLEPENPTVKFNSDTRKKLNFSVQERSDTDSEENESEQEDDEEKGCEIWFTDSGEKGGNYACAFVSKEVISLSLQILSKDADENEVVKEIKKGGGQKPPAYTYLRRKSRYCTDFSDHVEILDFLYKHTNPKRLDESVEQEIFRFIKNRVIQGKGGNQSYTSNSVSDVQEKIEIVESQPNLPTITEKSELIGLQYLKDTNNLVNNGNFKKAKEQISEAIEQFNQSDSPELLPAKLKQEAILGLRDESRCDFEDAAGHYSTAAKKAENDDTIQAYQVWSKIANIKEKVSQGDLDTAQTLIDEIEYATDDIHLIDLQKLTLLFDVYSQYTRGEQSDTAAVFDELAIEKNKLPTSDSIIQYNTDYSTAFTMLITKQRQKQLDIDSELDDDSLTVIRDAITPTGLTQSQSFQTRSEQDEIRHGQDRDNNQKKTDDGFERSYTETKRAQRDAQFHEEVKELYNYTCAVCGSDRMTPDGRPEVEAAHIRPVSEGGKDIITNGIALCRLHHWAFDNDWISIDDDYTVTVKNAPDVSGYEDFAQYQGSRLNLPESDEHRPDKDVIEFHRRHHGFEDNR